MSTFSLLIFVSAALYLGSIALFFKNKISWSIALLVLASFFLRLEMASLDPFLHNWDERFHALVAKNMMQDPLRPMLIKYPALPYDYTSWCCNHVWVHKQPLFLWQMAGSMQIFGTSEIALRLPSVVMGSLMVFFIFRICKRLTGSNEASFIAALFFSLSWYQLELTSGLISLDHNDIAFSFYILAGFWAFAEYLQRRSMKWIILIGLFSGAAILCKWMVGLLVYAGWGLSVLADKQLRLKRISYLHMAYALVVTLVVVLPWQLYILQEFPKESAWEYQYNTRHLFEVLEGHDHPWWFYFSIMPLHYGALLLVFLFGGMLLLLLQKNRGQLVVALLSAFWIVYLFFSIVPTRLQSFTFIAAPIAFIYVGVALEKLRSVMTGIHKWAGVAVILLIAFLAFDSLRLDKIREERKETNLPRNHKAYMTRVYKSLPDSIQGNKTLVLNSRDLENIELMFYRNLTAYNWFPPAEVLDSLKRKNYSIYYLPYVDGSDVPDYVKERGFVQPVPANWEK